MDPLQNLVQSAGGKPKVRQFPAPQTATVHSVTDDGLMVELDTQPGVLYGPAAWQRPAAAVGGDPGHSHDPGDPPAGTRCLVLFAGRGADELWVVAFHSWPGG